MEAVDLVEQNLGNLTGSEDPRITNAQRLVDALSKTSSIRSTLQNELDNIIG
jgi:hypothetical protein